MSSRLPGGRHRKPYDTGIDKGYKKNNEKEALEHETKGTQDWAQRTERTPGDTRKAH